MKKYEFQWGEQHSMISAEYWADSYGPYRLSYPDCPKSIDFIIISENKYLDAYGSSKMMKEWSNLSRIFLTKEGREAILNSSKKVIRDYYNFFSKFQKINLDKASNLELLELLKKYLNILRQVAPHFVVSQPEGLYFLTEKLYKELTRKKSSHLMSALISPTRPDITFKEQFELVKVAKKKKVTKGILYNYALKHAWLFFNSYNIEENIEFLRKRLKDKFDHHKKLSEMKRLRYRQDIIFKSLKSKEIKEICLFLQEIGVERFNLKDCWGGAEFRFLPLFHEIAKRIRVPFDSMMSAYTLVDFEKALLCKEMLPQKQAKQRAKEFIFWKKGRKLNLIEDKNQIQGIIKNIRKDEKTGASTQTQGVSANPGKVVGIARLVKSIDISHVLKDFKRFNKGDILVTWMTQPNMVLIARKAAAIIADEGGITSHAALIAREFNIPCIVGTKNATKILKDGDKIEVDADNGVVRKLK